MTWFIEIVCLVILAVLGTRFIGITGLIIPGIWLGFSVKFIKPEEMGILVIFGIPWKFYESGPHLVPFLPFCYLKKYPKKWYSLDYPARTVITKEGWYPEEEEEYPKGRKRLYGAQILNVDATAYIQFPRQAKRKREGEAGDLIEIYKSGIPIKDKELMDWTEESVVGALRLALGERTWKEATEEIDKIIRRANELFKAKDGALIKAGFGEENLRLVITEIKLPKELENMLPVTDQERLKAEAADFVAKRQAIEWVGMVLQSFAQSRGKKLKEIQEEIEKDKNLQKEFLAYAKEMNLRLEEANRGALIDIRVEKAEGFEKTLLETVALLKTLPLEKLFPPKKEKEERTLNAQERALRNAEIIERETGLKLEKPEIEKSEE